MKQLYQETNHDRSAKISNNYEQQRLIIVTAHASANQHKRERKLLCQIAHANNSRKIRHVKSRNANKYNRDAKDWTKAENKTCERNYM